MLRLGLGGRKSLEPQPNSGCQREGVCCQDRNFSCEQASEFWGKGSVHPCTGSWTELELQHEQGCKGAARGQDNKLRGSCTDNFFTWTSVFCLHLLTSESYQTAGFHLLSLLLMYELMKRTPFPIPKLSKISHCLSFNLNFQTAHFCLALWLSQKQIPCEFIVKNHSFKKHTAHLTEF